MEPRDDILDEALVRALLAVTAGSQPPSESLRERVLAGVESPHPPGVVLVRAGEGDWHQLVPGVRAKILYDDGHVRTWLARMEPGSSFPAHEHPVDEECLVLEGDLEADGVITAAGDYQVALAGTRHRIVHTRGGCLLMLRSASV